MIRRKKRKITQRASTTIISIIFVMACLTYIFTRLINLNFIEGSSMTDHYAGVAVVNRVAYEHREPQRGDVVSFVRDGTYYIKRIVGIPGDTLDFKAGSVLLNGKVYEEPYLEEGMYTYPLVEGYTYQVPAGMYFVMGDNRENSNDSRFYRDPYIDFHYITGRVVAVFNPYEPSAFIIERYRFDESS